MAPQKPTACRPAAYSLFAAQLPQLETTEGLLRAAVAIASHELTDVDLSEIEAQLDRLSGRIRRRVTSSRPEALLAHLHRVLFDEEGFTGNPGDYYNVRNSYLPTVLESRRGIPIALVLIYKCVAERVGLTVSGINSPGHFLAEVMMDGHPALVDPFYGGRILSRDEALKQIEETTGRSLPPLAAAALEASTIGDPLFRPATHRDWLGRMLRNLRQIFAHTGRPHDLDAMQELFALL